MKYFDLFFEQVFVNGKDFNNWLLLNTKRNSFLTWNYKGKIYNGLDSLRRIWIVEILRK